MMSFDTGGRQQGVALAVALLFLLVVTIISVIAASNSSLGLKMSANMQDSHSSFQSAEAGVIATLSLVGTADEPFERIDKNDPFADFAAADHPLKDLNDGPAAVDVDVIFMVASECPRTGRDSDTDTFDCDYYRVTSEHEAPKKSRTKVELGVVKNIIGSSALN